MSGGARITTYGAVVPSFDQAHLASLPAYAALRQALSDLANQSIPVPGLPRVQRRCDAGSASNGGKGTLVTLYFIVGAACLIIGQLIGWWMGYGRGKKDVLRALGRAGQQNRQRNAASQNGRPVKTSQGQKRKR
jgi:hypothetical protein